MQEQDMLKCTRCSETLELHGCFDGCYWNSENDEKGFDYAISLQCPKCGRVYTIGRIKNKSDFAREIEQLRPYKSR